MWPAGPAPVRHTPCPPQNHIIFVGTLVASRIEWLVIASSSVNSVSAVPSTRKVGTVICLTRSPGPRDANQSRSSALSVPVLTPVVKADVMCGSSRPLELGTPAAYSSDDQPPL